MSEKAIIIGGGLAGVSTLFELVSLGVPTTLLEAGMDLAAETSFANGGLLTDSMPDPWNSPGVGRHLIHSLFDPYAAMKLRPHAIPDLMGWGLKFLRNSTPARHRAATLANYTLASMSVRRTLMLRDDLGLAFDAATRGTLKILDSPHALTASVALAEMLARAGMRYTVLDQAATIGMEPLLADIKDRIHASIHFPADGAGDACKFTRALGAKACERGGVIRTGVAVRRIVTAGGRVAGVETAAGVEPATLVVVAAGCRSPALVAPLGLKLGIKPVKGYSVTFTVPPGIAMPQIPVLDDAFHAVATPLGDRLRLAGTAEFTGMDKTLSPERIENLLRFFRLVFPQMAAALADTPYTPWAGLRPMTADGVPYVGGSPIKGLWINSGHGHLGWTMASGSAALLAQLIAGLPPTIDPAPYAIDR